MAGMRIAVSYRASAGDVSAHARVSRWSDRGAHAARERPMRTKAAGSADKGTDGAP